MDTTFLQVTFHTINKLKFIIVYHYNWSWCLINFNYPKMFLKRTSKTGQFKQSSCLLTFLRYTHRFLNWIYKICQHITLNQPIFFRSGYNPFISCPAKVYIWVVWQNWHQHKCKHHVTKWLQVVRVNFGHNWISDCLHFNDNSNIYGPDWSCCSWFTDKLQVTFCWMYCWLDIRQNRIPSQQYSH